MTDIKSIAELNRDVGERVLEDAKRNPHAYAGRYVGIANGKVVIATDDLHEFARCLQQAEPDRAKTYGVDLQYDYDKVFEIWEVH